MKYVVGFLLFLVASVVSAQLGEDLKALEKRWGEGEKARRAYAPFDAVYYFNIEKKKVKAGFVGDQCVHLAFRADRRGRELLEHEIEAILKDNVVDPEDTDPWTVNEKPVSPDPQIPRRTRLTKAWTRSDDKAFAWASVIEFAVFSDKYLDAAKAAKERARKDGELARLKRVVLGRDFDKALKAIQDISKLGPEYRDELPKLVNVLLDRCREVLMKELQRAKKRDAKAADELAKLRALALANIKILSKENDKTLKDATQYYKDLQRLTAAEQEALAKRGKLLDGIRDELDRHRRLIKIMKQLESSNEKYIDTEAEAKLAKLVKDVFGATLDEVRSLQRPPGRSPSNPALDELWRHQFNRAIEAYNRTVHGKRITGQGEYNNLKIVNDYRESLGLFRLELDARLVQSARRHSKEMVDLKYFSHESPSPGLTKFSDRIKKAGYPSPGGENIAMGKADGESVFWMWFYSPGHHRNMASGRYKALGVGKWNSHYTQNFGRARLLVFASAEERKKAQPLGDILKP